MISVQEARNIIHSQALDLSTEYVHIDASLGRVLAEPIYTDRALPPFDRVTMDGIAIATDDYFANHRRFVRTARQFAGEPQVDRGTAPGTCVETSTGAMLPANCDAIIPYEWLHETDFGFEIVQTGEVRPMMNVHQTGSDLDQGSAVLNAGSRIDASTIAILASVGCYSVPVRTLPRIAVISTGDELVEVDQLPLSYQIRKSNDRAIAAVLAASGVVAQRFHLADAPETIEDWLTTNRSSFDALVFSGGVSKGKRDFLPDVLERVGIRCLFHRISQRPGKPLWFGAGDQVVFGLPGNPVSALVGAVVYIRWWMDASLGLVRADAHPSGYEAQLGSNIEFKPHLTLFKPAVIECVGGKFIAHPADHNGSGDFSSLAGIHGFIEMDAAQPQLPKGSTVCYHPLVWKRN